MTEPKIDLFLSYGRDPKLKKIVNKIKERLKQEFRLWVDQEKIKTEDDWRREIVQAIDGTRMTVGLLHAHSTRHQSVCLDELSISISVPGRKLITIILENEKKLKIPTTVTRNQWLDLSEWKKYIATDRWDEYFEQRMDQLCTSIKSEENYQFQGEITTLYKILQPSDFNGKAFRYTNCKNNVKRNWLTKQITAWTKGTTNKRVLLLTGGAGTGKSHFSAIYQHYNPACGAAVFCEYTKVTQDYVKRIIRYLAYTFATKYPDYRYQLLQKFRLDGLVNEENIVSDRKCAAFFSENTEDYLFDTMLCMPVIGGHNTSTVVVIDALDEAGNGETNPLVQFICGDMLQKMPAHIKFLITARPEPMVLAAMERLKPRVINLNREEAAGTKDIERYIIKRLSKAGMKATLARKAAAGLAPRCHQMFLYAELVCDEIISHGLSVQNISMLPEGISGLYLRYFDRLFPCRADYDKVKPLLRILCGFDTANPSETILKNITGTNDEALNDFYIAMRSFAVSHPGDKETRVALFHKSLYDWLTDKTLSGRYAIDLNLGKQEILAYCKQIIDRGGKGESFDSLLTVYRFVQKNGSLGKVKLTDAFLYALQSEAYTHDAFELYKEVVQKISHRAALWGHTRISLLSQLDLVLWKHDRDENSTSEDAKQLMDQLDSQYGDMIKNDPELYGSAMINRFYMLGNQPETRSQALDMAKDMIGYIRSCTEQQMPSKKRNLAKVLYHTGRMKYMNHDYENSIEYCILANETAEEAYDDPRKMICLADIILGSSYRKLNRYDEAIAVLKRALEYNTSLYGRYSLDAARACHNLMVALYDKAVYEKTEISPHFFTLMEEQKRIITAIVGDKSHRMLRCHYYMAYAMKYCTQKARAIEAAQAYLAMADKAKALPEEKQKMEDLLKELTA